MSDTVYKYRIRKQTLGNGSTRFVVQKKEVYYDKTYGIPLLILSIIGFLILYPIYLQFADKWESLATYDDYAKALEDTAKRRGEQYDNLVIKEKTVDIW